MFTDSRIHFPVLEGDWKRDGPKVVNALDRFILGLNEPGALAIGKTEYWTPAMTFATAGDLSVTYSTQKGDLAPIGDHEYLASFVIVTSAFTHTTASGSMVITGLPVEPSSDTGFSWDGPCVFGGMTLPANYTQCNVTLGAGSNLIAVTMSGSTVAPAFADVGEFPTGGNVVLRGNIRFRAR